MATAIIAIVGSLLGVVLGSALSFLAQNSLGKRTRKWELEDTKRESYADFLRSISASYAKAKVGEGDPEEADLLRATAVIELIAERKIAEHARLLQKKVTDVHARLRQQYPVAEETGVREADQARRDLISLFKADLDIPPDVEDDHQAGQARVSGQPGTG
jgi:gas vesicle protein